MQYITFDDLPVIPADVAVCPICGAPIEITDIDEWETETLRVTETGLHINCSTQPDIDSDEWWSWHKWHWSMPYVYWLPVEARVYKWFNSRFRLTPHTAAAAGGPADEGDDNSRGAPQL